MDIMENMQMEVMNMDISERLQELRKKEGYSQEQVAEMLGLSRQAISKWESGQGKLILRRIRAATSGRTAKPRICKFPP